MSKLLKELLLGWAVCSTLGITVLYTYADAHDIPYAEGCEFVEAIQIHARLLAAYEARTQALANGQDTAALDRQIAALLEQGEDCARRYEEWKNAK